VNDFIPDRSPGGSGYQSVGFEQAALEDRLAGYASTQKPATYTTQIIELLVEAGATEISLLRGSVNERCAYRLQFFWGGMPVEIVQVALPSRVNTAATHRQAERQALYHLLNELRFELERRHFHPDMPAFVPYMLAPAQNGSPVAVWQLLKEAQRLAIAAPKESVQVFEGEIIDD